jgi:hypothetical protein
MEPKPLRSYPRPFKEPRQERIYRRLLLIGPGPAAFYRDACRLMTTEPPFDSITHLVAHLLREIESAMRAVVEPILDRPRDLEQQRTSGDEKHQAAIRIVLRGLDIPETSSVAQAWLQVSGQKNDYALPARAHRDALAQPRRLDQEFLRFWSNMEAIFDVVLQKYEARYLASHQTLDALLGKAVPTQGDVHLLRNQVPNNLVAFGYFFDNLNSPAWLEPLRAGGFFGHPPDPDYDDEQGTVRFPGWPSRAIWHVWHRSSQEQFWTLHFRFLKRRMPVFI